MIVLLRICMVYKQIMIDKNDVKVLITYNDKTIFKSHCHIQQLTFATGVGSFVKTLISLTWKLVSVSKSLNGTHCY